jgi:glycosyltransferase involved in cell wall biosynthesis
VVVVTRSEPGSGELELSGRIRVEQVALPRWLEALRKPDFRHVFYYNLWQIAAFLRARRLVRNETFHVVHHLTYCCTWQLTLMPFLGIPFVFGPVGENPRVPTQLASRFGCGFVLAEYFKRIIRLIGKRIVLRPVYRRAAAVLCQNQSVFRELPDWCRSKAIFMPNGVGFEEISGEKEPEGLNFNPAGKAFNVLYVGRLVPIKNPDLALEAFLRLASERPEAKLLVVGDGPLRARLEHLVIRAGLTSSVKFLGWQPHEKVRRLMEQCDVFLYPSCEGAGVVVLEAMSLGKPIVCLRFGGPWDYAGPDGCVGVPVGNVNQTVAALARALLAIHDDTALRQALGHNAYRRYAEEYSWSSKMRAIQQVYEELVPSRRFSLER